MPVRAPSWCRAWLVLGKGDEDETFVVWDETDAAAYAFAKERYRVDEVVPADQMGGAVDALREVATMLDGAEGIGGEDAVAMQRVAERALARLGGQP